MRPSREVESLLMEHYPEVVLARVFEHGCRSLFLGHADGISKLDDESVLQLVPRYLRPTRLFWNERMSITINGTLPPVYKLTHYNFKGSLMKNHLRQDFAPFTTATAGVASYARGFKSRRRERRYV